MMVEDSSTLSLGSLHTVTLKIFTNKEMIKSQPCCIENSFGLVYLISSWREVDIYLLNNYCVPPEGNCT